MSSTTYSDCFLALVQGDLILIPQPIDLCFPSTVFEADFEAESALADV